MHDLNIELWKLGITAKTQHNEVAPAQHELARFTTRANVAVEPQPVSYGNHERSSRTSGSCLPPS